MAGDPFAIHPVIVQCGIWKMEISLSFAWRRGRRSTVSLVERFERKARWRQWEKLLNVAGIAGPKKNFTKEGKRDHLLLHLSYDRFPFGVFVPLSFLSSFSFLLLVFLFFWLTESKFFILILTFPGSLSNRALLLPLKLFFLHLQSLLPLNSSFLFSLFLSLLICASCCLPRIISLISFLYAPYLFLSLSFPLYLLHYAHTNPLHTNGDRTRLDPTCILGGKHKRSDVLRKTKDDQASALQKPQWK